MTSNAHCPAKMYDNILDSTVPLAVNIIYYSVPDSTVPLAVSIIYYSVPDSIIVFLCCFICLR